MIQAQNKFYFPWLRQFMVVGCVSYERGSSLMVMRGRQLLVTDVDCLWMAVDGRC